MKADSLKKKLEDKEELLLAANSENIRLQEEVRNSFDIMRLIFLKLSSFALPDSFLLGYERYLPNALHLFDESFFD